MTKTRPRCDIFCTVIDNFGDAGVCWRLARQLHHEHGWPVRLWIDKPETLRQLVPDLDTQAIDVRPWPDELPLVEPAEVVIEAFGCTLPAPYVARMAARKSTPVWLNLDYLSAESWVAECHLGVSPHPTLPLIKHFFFPGFGNGTGGLLREHDYDVKQQAFCEEDFRREFSIGPRQSDALTISLFSYANPALPALMQAWQGSATPVTLLVPGSKDSRSVSGLLEVIPLPFLPQERFDELLWTSDLNFVRGEDSFVRAQWAGKPFVWQIYPQDDDAHQVKLCAFLDRYTKVGASDTAAKRELVDFWKAWNGIGNIHWDNFASALPALNPQAIQWAERLQQQKDLATNLVQFCLARLK